jgi:spore coat polysaccharide biosynthesis protein SpsF (cytidylyltransferase family)
MPQQETAAIILQARMGSRRLPGKVLADLAGRSVLGHCIWRLSASGIPVIVATTTRSEDDAVVRAAETCGAFSFRGAVDDVLGRYVAAAEAFQVTEIVRATADNPAVDIDAPARVLALIRRTGVDHIIECGLPYGAAVEAVTTEALARAAAETDDPHDREHVTPFVRRAAGFTMLSATAPGHLRQPALRLTIDTAEDLRRMRVLLAPYRQAAAPPPLSEIIAKAAGVFESDPRAKLQERAHAR